MKLIHLCVILLLAVLQAPLCVASNVLVFMPICSKSHKYVVDHLMEELAIRGHSITEVSLFQTTLPHENIESIFLNEMRATIDGLGEEASNISIKNSFLMLTKIIEYTDFLTESLMNDGKFKSFIENPGIYDVIIVNTNFNDNYLPLVPIVAPGTPIILTAPSTLFSYIAWGLNIPFPISYIPLQLISFTSEMTFIERVINTISIVGYNFMFNLISWVSFNAMKARLPNANLAYPRDVEKNASLIILNSHFTLTGTRPSMPYAVEAGGMHCKPAKQLPEEFSNFVDGSGDYGFIVFSLGTVVLADSLNPHLVESFTSAFKQISPIRVIWKHVDLLGDISSNVLCAQYIPQQDLIGHPKCRLVITHGGLLSIQEANYHGVPILGLPSGVDKGRNLLTAIQNGVAKSIDWRYLNFSIISEAITSIIHNDSYKKNAEEFGRLVKDRPQQPLDTAAYWVEYIIRHKGAKHLKSAAQNLNFLQYFLIDVITFIFVGTILFVYIFVRLCKCLFSKRKRSNGEYIPSSIRKFKKYKKH